MKIIAHQSTLPTAQLLAELTGAHIVIPDGPVRNLQLSLRESSDVAVNWGRRLSLPHTSQSIMPTTGSGRILNGAATLEKPVALQMLKNANVPVPQFLAGQLLIRPPMTRRGKLIFEHEGVVMERIDKDLEFRVDVCNNKAFRLHVKTGPDDKIAWNREGTEWVTFGSKTMLRGPSDRFEGATQEQMRTVIDAAKNAVKALNYDFGAVDIIRERGTGKIYVLEVNAAPSLNEDGARKYANRLLRMLGLQPLTEEDETE